MNNFNKKKIKKIKKKSKKSVINGSKNGYSHIDIKDKRLNLFTALLFAYFCNKKIAYIFLNLSVFK